MAEETEDTNVHGRRKFIAGGAAGLAAGSAALLAGATAAGASTLNGHDISGALKWIDFGAGSLTDVTLGTGGTARAALVPCGEMAAMSLCIRVGDDASTTDLGAGPWCIDGSELPSEFQPVELPEPYFGQIVSGWQGIGTVYNVSTSNKKQFDLGCSWQRFLFPDYGPLDLGNLLVWGLMGVDNDGSGDVMLNWNGEVPYGRKLDANTVLYSTIMYQIAPPSA